MGCFLKDLPDNWNSDPIPKSVKKVGDRWIQNQESVIKKGPTGGIFVSNVYHEPIKRSLNNLIASGS